MPAPWTMLLVLTPAAAGPLWQLEGVATTPAGVVAYREVHWQQGEGDGGARWVQYLCPDGRAFARKHLPATSRPQARGFDWEDRRSGQRATVEVRDDTVSIDWQEHAGSPRRRGRLALPPGAVVDAGFDAAVRTHWASLLGGEAVRLPFLVPGRQRFYPVRVEHLGAVRWQGLPARRFAVVLDTWYGAAAPRLGLVYAEADRRLLEFDGHSNLRDGRGDYPRVVVRFAGMPVRRPAQPGPPPWAQPLAAGCGPGDD